MDIKFYNCESGKNFVSKSLTNVGTASCKLKSPTSKINPVVIVDKTYRNHNYAYISTFQRYYYITDCIFLDNNRVELHLKCDVLMSYASQIKNASGVITRDGSRDGNYTKYLPDNNKFLYNSLSWKRLNFPVSLYTNPQYILTVSGGGGE